MSDYRHLDASTIEMLSASPSERINYLFAPLFVLHAAAAYAEDRLDNLFRHSREDSRYPGLMLVGPSNAGKSLLLKRFIRRHASKDADSSNISIVSMTAPDRPDEKSFFIQLIKGYGVPYKPNDTARALMSRGEMLLTNYNTRILIIDEFHAMVGGTPAEQRAILTLLKRLSGEFRLHIVAAGTKEAIRIMQPDKQFQNRFPPIPVPRHSLGPEFAGILKGFQKRIPLPESSGLELMPLAKRIHYETEGLIGEVRTLTQELAQSAIKAGSPRITEDHFSRIIWTRPSSRMDIADHVAD